MAASDHWRGERTNSFAVCKQLNQLHHPLLSFLDDVYVRARGYMSDGEYGFAPCFVAALVMCLKDWSILAGYVFSVILAAKLIAAAGHTGPALLFVTGFLLLLLVHDKPSGQGDMR